MKQKDSTARVVLFDLGNVLVSIHPGAFARHLGIDAGMAYRKYQTRVVRIVQEYEDGRGTTDEFLEKLVTLFKRRYDREEIRAAMLDVIGEPVEGMEEVVKKVAATCRVGLVSNTNELHFDFCRGALPALSRIPLFFLSYQLKCSKPSRAYYDTVLKQLDVPSSSVVFVDDLDENITGALASGMDGIRFESSIQLEGELTARGIL